MKFWSNSDIPSVGPYVPEKRLLAAVLQRAISDLIGGEGELREGARSWLMDDEPTDAPLTFRFICEALDLDCMSLRKAITIQAQSQSDVAVGEAAY
ncbi:MAG: hypothetical protein J5J00_08705 [Deltaproteobacteria bacterium]|nr:hypothetical protein [Deltaproteobacteria bacterium]